MAKQYFMEEVTVLKQAIQEASRIRDYSGEEMERLVGQKLSERIDWAREHDSDLYWYYQNLSFKEKNTLRYTITESVEGLGILGKIIMDPDITEVMINGFDTIFVEKAGKLMRLEERFENDEDLTRIVQRFVSSMDRTVDASNPIVDARLEDGSRVNVVLKPVALNGPIMTIRKFPKDTVTMDQLISWGSVTEEVVEFVKMIVKAKYNIFVSGGTGSGKTTFLNAMSDYIPKDERIITIEDNAELQIRGVPNLVRLEARNANLEGEGAVTIRDLIKSALRMRPERRMIIKRA